MYHSQLKYQTVLGINQVRSGLEEGNALSLIR